MLLYILHLVYAFMYVHFLQSQINQMDATKRLENLQKLEHLKQHLLELEKQVSLSIILHRYNFSELTFCFP